MDLISAPPPLQRTHTHTHTQRSGGPSFTPNPKKNKQTKNSTNISSPTEYYVEYEPIYLSSGQFCSHNLRRQSYKSCFMHAFNKYMFRAFFPAAFFSNIQNVVFEFSLDSTENLWNLICKELFLIVGLDEAISSGQMKSIQNEMDCIEESGYAKFLAIEITRARYALQVSANSYKQECIPPAAVAVRGGGLHQAPPGAERGADPPLGAYPHAPCPPWNIPPLGADPPGSRPPWEQTPTARHAGIAYTPPLLQGMLGYHLQCMLG